MKIYIVVLNWNRKDDTLACLQSLIRLKIADFRVEIIVVDNGSENGSQEVIRRSTQKTKGKKIDRIRLIENKENLGFAGGNNVGLRLAQEKGADFALVLNNDTVADEDLLIDLLNVANKYKDAGVFSPKIYFARGFEFHKDNYKQQELGRVVWYAGGLLDWANVLGSNRGVNEVDSGQYDSIQDTDFATGACMFIRSEVFRAVGFFDEDFFMYLEDVDFCCRARSAGWRVLYSPPAKVWHKVAQSSGIGSKLNDYYITRNRLLFGLRYATLRTKFALLRESLRFFQTGGSKKQAVVDFYLHRWGKQHYE